MRDQNYRKALQYFQEINAAKASNGGNLLEEGTAPLTGEKGGKA